MTCLGSSGGVQLGRFLECSLANLVCVFRDVNSPFESVTKAHESSLCVLSYR